MEAVKLMFYVQKCESITKITFRNLLHTPYRFKCKECRNNININHLENFKPQLEILEKQLIEIEQSLNNIDIAKMINLTKIN